MPNYTYLIVGGGMTADAAAQALHEADPVGSIGLISAEPHPPYDRPPLSKALWKGEPEEKIWRKTAATGAALHLGRRITALDPRARSVTDDRGTVYRYQKLLLATGGVPRRLPLKTDQIIYFRTLDDYRRLRALASQSVRFAVIGGGFIGSEVAAALRMQQRDVTMLVPEAGLGARVFPADLAAFLVGYYREKGVTMRMGEGMAGLDRRAGSCVVRTTLGTRGWRGSPGARAHASCAPPGAASSWPRCWSPGSVSCGAWSSRSRRACAWTTGLWWMRPAVPARSTSMPRATSRTSRIPRCARGCVWSTRTTPTRWGAPPVSTWRAGRRPIITCRFSTPTCSSWATKPWVTSTPVSRRSPTGRRSFGRGSSTT